MSQYKSTQCIKKCRCKEILNQLQVNTLRRKAVKDTDIALDGCFIPNRIFKIKRPQKSRRNLKLLRGPQGDHP